MTNPSTSTPGDPLRAFVCPQCGAPLSEQQAQLETITCAHCGIVFERSKAVPIGGINLSTGGKVTIQGRVVGGNVIHAPHGQTPPISDKTPGGGISIHAGGDLHIGGDLVGRDLVIMKDFDHFDDELAGKDADDLVGRDLIVGREPIIVKTPGRLARLRAWFANLFRRPK